MTFGSLFSGIGGMDLGLERAGMKCRWQVRIDPYCNRVLEKHWPNVKRYGDIQQIAGPELERVDCIAGGFPCQDVSGAGKRVGLSGDRSGLWFQMLRLLRELRPAFLLVENVPGLLVRGFGRVLGDVAESGYDAEWQCIPAASVGAPHIRDRVFILAYPRCINREILSLGGADGGQGRDVASTRDGWRQAEWDTHRKLVDLVPGVHPRTSADWWLSQSRMARSVNGISDWMERSAGLGNAVVPQVAEWIGRRILEAFA